MPSPDPAPSPRTGRSALRLLLAVTGGVLLFAAAMVLLHAWNSAKAPSPPAQPVTTKGAAFEPPPDSAIPEGPSGDAIRRGREIFINTPANAGEFVGNTLSCSNCHLDAGRKPDSAPLWAAWLAYPKYRAKNKQINTMEDRVMGCFTYSMNGQASKAGGPPPAGHQVYKDLQIYMHWMATGAPTNTELAGAGYPELKKTRLGYDPERGAKVYASNCVTCHGSDGQGQRDANGRPVFPPLWGPQSYNWGAGMARVNTAAGFIQANMPLGQGGRLSDQDAWDVAAFVNSHERPSDPRQRGMSIAEAAAKFHNGEEIYYGKQLEGTLLGVGTPAPERH